MAGLNGEERELLRPREGCSQCAGLVWCPNCEDVMDQLAEAMDAVVARHVNAALTEAAERIEGHICDPVTACEDVNAGGPCPYDHAARMVRDLRT